MKKWKVKFWANAQAIQQRNQLKEMIIKVEKVSQIRPQLQVYFPHCCIKSVVQTG